jgi:hypothetical protein
VTPATDSASARPGAAALLTNRLFQVAGAGLLVYALLSGQWVVVIASLAIAWTMSRFAQRLDAPLAPFWPYRNRLPRPTRVVLAWVLPAAISLLITVHPALGATFSRLPIVGPEASLFICMTTISALVAYVLIRNPRLQPVR